LSATRFGTGFTWLPLLLPTVVVTSLTSLAEWRLVPVEERRAADGPPRGCEARGVLGGCETGAGNGYEAHVTPG
jgi:hypothetical protein